MKPVQYPHQYLYLALLLQDFAPNQTSSTVACSRADYGAAQHSTKCKHRNQYDRKTIYGVLVPRASDVGGCASSRFCRWQREATGPNGEFEDPETSQVETLSSRGPCIVRGDTREKPTTCAADGVSTSTPGRCALRSSWFLSPLGAAMFCLSQYVPLRGTFQVGARRGISIDLSLWDVKVDQEVGK